MRSWIVVLTAALVVGVPSTAMAQSSAPAGSPAAGNPSVEGMWINPMRTVVVRTGPCGAKLCGWIAWANPQAQSDARDGGTDTLVGTELLENYQRTESGAWSGTVFVVDMGKHLYSKIVQTSANALQIKGCILGGLLCKSQIWTRVDRMPGA
ncbi:DUF2147 domain-containing protein [Sphingomonas sp. NFX23]|jgi:uncharacterized protein (DUF2147 family)|uniref:DUF2147 domain-containing protein n=1 Tax=Sphingomonas sp. NFX23 TaxID=2819532 RepID=UPI003CEE34B8